MKRFRGLAVIVVVAVAASLVGFWPYRAALFPTPSQQEASMARLKDALTFVPASDQVGPTVLVFHGCSGQTPGFFQHVSAWLVPKGYHVLFVDSLKARDIPIQTGQYPVCDGKVLWGSERAQDVFAALALLKDYPLADPQQLVLLGYSHGGWTIFDALSQAGHEGHGYTAPSAEALAGVKGVIAYYPFCGFPSSHAQSGVALATPLLMFLAGADTVVSPQECLNAAANFASQPLDIRQFAGAEHVFDQPSGMNSEVPAMARAAEAQAEAFLAEHLNSKE
ncbi:dienelactone hydrolase family protein [Atopomonas sediminilitoris]|uniref:dienelactone hydrolase family protein n=1 Tax=Atopomonas sediminilitoris TaxID=2919919 RepID=UPI001F4DECE4|nr:dienelactone hydrolase family protein [Atopomonas sediminilitoris]MCJ8169559.1 dienelactone hydrolase family protein [Atopomonas sediminilitoris]